MSEVNDDLRRVVIDFAVSPPRIQFPDDLRNAEILPATWIGAEHDGSQGWVLAQYDPSLDGDQFSSSPDGELRFGGLSLRLLGPRSDEPDA